MGTLGERGGEGDTHRQTDRRTEEMIQDRVLRKWKRVEALQEER